MSYLQTRRRPCAAEKKDNGTKRKEVGNMADPTRKGEKSEGMRLTEATVRGGGGGGYLLG